MKGGLTKSQVDRLGDRLRNDLHNETDLKLLDEFRRSFHEAYETTIKTIRDRTNLEPTGRPAKSTSAIIEKLKRESIRLSQIQDIAGCRIVVATIIEQNVVVSSLCEAFPEKIIVDRRLNPSHGYRGVHTIILVNGKSIEIQVRSSLQHLWAEFSEKLADIIDPSIKYGGGDDDIRDLLQGNAGLVTRIEEIELQIAHILNQEKDVKTKMQLEELQKQIIVIKQTMTRDLNHAIGRYSKL